IGFDAGATRIEDALAWAGRHGFFYLDFNADRDANRLDTWDDARVRAVRDTCERHGIHLGLHTSSAVNVAELAPHVSGAVNDYLRPNGDLAVRLHCEWVVGQAGYHFSSALGERPRVSLERLRRLTAYAEKTGAHLVLENLNREPDRAEIHYLAHTVEECRT